MSRNDPESPGSLLPGFRTPTPPRNPGSKLPGLSRRTIGIFVPALLCSCNDAAPVPAPTTQPVAEPAYVRPSPARATRVAGGYALTNRYLHVVVSDQTGDVAFFGPDAQHNLAPAGLSARLAGLPEVPPTGTIEARDDQTWQFYGSDPNHVTWRKIYCLQDDALLVSLIVTNEGPAPTTMTVELRGTLPGFQPQTHDPEHLLAAGPTLSADFRGYNQFPAPDERPAPPVLIHSDPFPLAPGKRNGYTTRWQLLPTK